MKTLTIAQQLKPSEIDFDTLHSNYHPMLVLVKKLIGVIPNCDPLLEIWPTGFRTYNLLVPNCLNLPFSLFGLGTPKKLLGLAMYASSRAAECSYCSAHTCAFALRRGAEPSYLFNNRVPREIAVIEIAEALSQIPSRLSKKQCVTLAQYFSPADIEWIILSIGMMGFLNKFMDATGVELEADTIAEVGALLASTGWNPGKHTRADTIIPKVVRLSPTDSLKTYFRVLQQAPSALRLEKQWTVDVPDNYSKAGVFLEKHTGYRFPLLSQLKHKRAIRALTTILRDNLDAQKSDLGLTTKCLAGLVYATVVNNNTLAKETSLLLAHFAPETDEMIPNSIIKFANQPPLEEATQIEQAFLTLSNLPMLSEKTAAALILAKATSPSPAKVNSDILAQVNQYLTPASIIELMVWLSIQQLLHRVGCFYEVMNSNFYFNSTTIF